MSFHAKWMCIGILIFTLSGCWFDDSDGSSPEITLKATPSTLIDGETVRLEWTSKDADSCTALGSWSGAKSINGSEDIIASPPGNLTFTMACTGNGKEASTSQTIAVNANPNSVSVALPVTGATATLTDVATVTVPENSIASPTTLKVQRTEAPDIFAIYDEAAPLFQLNSRASYQVRIEVGADQPTSTVDVVLRIPQQLRDAATVSDEIRALYLNDYDDGTEHHQTMEALPERGARTESSITVSLRREAFYTNQAGKFEAYLLLALTPTAPSSQIPAAIPSSEARAKIMENGGGTCGGVAITSPVDPTFTINSGYGPRPQPKPGASKFHLGVDYTVPSGTAVYAAAAGKLFHKINKGNISTGYGYYVYINHDGGGFSLYGHLTNASQTVPDGTHVEAGQAIGVSDNTGNSTGAHLHFEYGANGSYHVGASRTDPEPCIGSVTNGSIGISDNGNLADDSFAISFNGARICQTAIGLANNCSIGALRPGTYTLALEVLVAPDNVGTYLIVVNDANIKIDGASSASGTLPQGGSRNFTLTVAPVSSP